MRQTPDITAAAISEVYKTLFCFYGVLSPEGFLIELAGDIFKEAKAKPELLIGQKFSETVFWQSAPHIPLLLQEKIQNAAKGNITKFQTDFRLSAHKSAFVEMLMIPQKAEKDKVEKIVFTAFDLTEKEGEIRFHKNRSEQLLYAAQSAEIGLWYWDLVENKISSTPKCNEILNLSEHEEITFDSFAAMLHPEDKDRVIASLRDSQVNNTEYAAEYRIINPDGLIQWIAAHGETFSDENNNPQTMTGMIRRLSEERVNAVETARLLERERELLEQAEQASRSKDYFIAFVSHELRSPLNSILGWSKVLLTKEVDENTRRSALETILRSAQAQAKLIEDMVDSARVAAGKLRLDLTEVNLYEILNDTYQSNLPTAQSRNITLNFNAETEQANVVGDQVRLQQVFTNLITNALKFTPSGGEIALNLSKDSGSAIVSVKDSGSGISAEFLPNVFKQFTQSEADLNKDKTGLGLGLTIVKTLVEKQNGTVKAESEGRDKGATFTVTLPLVTAEKSAGSKNSNLCFENLNVLVVEDDEDSREVLEIYLKQNGATVHTSESAASGFKFLTETQDFIPDLIISDIGMPDEDGYSFISKVRNLADEKISKIPAIALTAYPEAEVAKKSAAAGFDTFTNKPCEPEVLSKKILNLTKKRNSKNS